MVPVKPVLMRSRALWRRWLERHHASKKELWLAYYKAHTGKPSVTYVEAVEEALCFGWIDGQVQRIDDESWCQRFTPRRPGSSWSKVNLRRFARLVADGRVAEAGVAAGPTKETKVAKAFWDQPDVTPPEVERGITEECGGVEGLLRAPALETQAIRRVSRLGEEARDPDQAIRKGHRHARARGASDGQIPSRGEARSG